MNLKTETLIFVLLGMVVFLESTMGLPRSVRPQRFQARRASGPSAARQIPMGPRPPMMPSKRYATAPMTKPAAAVRPYKRDQFPFSLSSLLGLSTLDSSSTLFPTADSGTVPMSLDDAFKMGYSAGKSVATGDIMRNQYKPMCGQDNAYGVSQCGGATSYNFYFPQQTQPITNYLPDPGFAYIPDTGYGTDDLINTIPVNEDDDYYAVDYIPPQIYPDTWTYVPDNTDIGVVVDPQVVVQPDTLVDTASTVYVSPDGTVTPVAIDSTGTVLLPVGTVDDITVPDVLSNK